MNKSKIWNKEKLISCVAKAKSFRQLLSLLGLVEAGGNYAQIKKHIRLNNLDTSHFTGRAWNKGRNGGYMPRVSLDKILVEFSEFQSYKLKKRLFIEKLKLQQCEECGWAKLSEDGRIPLELDHINGNRYDNRLSNLRILCPNCHSLKPTHRGRNKKARTPG